MKWGHPCYMHAGRYIAIICALRGDVHLSFFDAVLLKDPVGVLKRQGLNSRHSDMIRFTGTDQILEREPVILSTLREAIGCAEQGSRPPREPGRLGLPDDLVEALDADPELAQAFRALTPGRQRSYAVALASATRVARIVRFRGRIIAGRGVAIRRHAGGGPWTPKR